MRHIHSRLTIVFASLTLSACGTTDVSEPVVLNSPVRFSKSVKQGLTIQHDYPEVRSKKEFDALVQRLEAQKFKNGTKNGAKNGPAHGYSGLQECGLLEASPQGGLSGQNDVAHRLGGVQVWARAGSNFGYLWALNFLFLIPDRFVDHCIGWRYGPVSSTYEEGISVESYGTEDDDDAPSSPPDGVSAEDFFDLNMAEQKLIWTAYATMSAQDFQQYIAKLKQAKAEAEQWSAAVEPAGAHNGPQDALRHAFWNCRMSQLLGENTARAWGNAHEKYSDAPAEARMDLHNNAAGRMVARLFESCSDGVLDARAHDLLRLGTGPSPSLLNPLSPQPPPPAEHM